MYEYGIKITTHKSIDDFEIWLENNISGEWSFKLDGMTKNNAKIIIFYFENENDKNKFKNFFQ